ncbi:hypothetical protein Tco_0576937 [Tanacetum coccineum]
MNFITLFLFISVNPQFPYNGQAVFTNEWDLASLEYSQEIEVPYCTELPTPDDIRRLLKLERVMAMGEYSREYVRTRRDIGTISRLLLLTVVLGCCEEHIQTSLLFVKRIECARATPTANLPYGMFLTRLYRHVIEAYPHLDNDIYNIVDRVMRPLALVLKNLDDPRK